MFRTWWLAALGAGCLSLFACGPLEDGGGGIVGAPCVLDTDCAANGCCGDGTAAVGVSDQPVCPATCSNGRQPHSFCVNGGSGIVACLSNHCGVASGAPGSCTQ